MPDRAAEFVERSVVVAAEDVYSAEQNMRADVLIVRQSLAAVRLGLRQRRVGVASPAGFYRLHVETPEASVGGSVALIELDGALEKLARLRLRRPAVSS